MIEEKKEINMLNDCLFKAFIRSEEARECVVRFLNAVTGIKKEVLRMASYEAGEQVKQKMYEKKMESDVIIKVDEENQIIIEMNQFESDNIFEKNASYGFSSILELTRPRMNAYPQVLVINLDHFNRYKTEKPMLHFQIQNEEGIIETKMYQSIHFILANIENPRYTLEKEIKDFLKLFKKWDMEELKGYRKEDEDFVAAVRKVEDLTSDPEFMGYYSIEERIKQDKEDAYQTGERIGKEAGVEIGTTIGKEVGIEIGEKQKQLEIAIEMLKEKESIEKICKYTHLTIEEINKINASF